MRERSSSWKLESCFWIWVASAGPVAAAPSAPSAGAAFWTSVDEASSRMRLPMTSTMAIRIG